MTEHIKSIGDDFQFVFGTRNFISPLLVGNRVDSMDERHGMLDDFQAHDRFAE